jgi:hypothetical protein
MFSLREVPDSTPISRIGIRGAWHIHHILVNEVETTGEGAKFNTIELKV